MRRKPLTMAQAAKPRRKSPEQDLQKAVMEFLHHAMPKPCVITAINPVPGKTRAAAGLSKALGMKKGMPDIHILWHGRGYYLELKAPGGRVDDDQRRVMAEISDAEGYVAVCYDIGTVIHWLTKWGIPLKARLAA